MTVNARCTTTSAPFTASRTLAWSWTSPWRYSVFRRPWLAGSNGRRAMPTMRFTRRDRSSAVTSAMPRSPVGPVTATVRPSWATRVLYSASVPRDVLAVGQPVVLVRHHRVGAGAAAHVVALPVVDVDRVVPRAGVDRVVA